MKKRGFTLAEILIALGIIGVVAALTIPSMTTGHNKNVWAKSLAVAKSNFDRAMTTVIMKELANNLSETEVWQAADEDFIPKLNKVFELKKYEEDYIDGIDGTSYISRNGIVYFIKKEDNDATDKSGDLTKSVAKVTIDINAKNKPNTVGKDIFYYYLGDNGILYPFGGEDVEKAFGETYSCDSTGLEGCAGRLAENGYNMDY